MLKRLSIFLCTIIYLSSCHKNDSPIGIGILPHNDLVSGAYIEITPEVSYSVNRKALNSLGQLASRDSVVTSKISNSNLLGSTNDPIFGRTDASIYCNFEVPGGIYDLGVSPQLDSVVLSLVYNTSTNFVGDTSQPLSIDAYELTESIYYDSLYFSGRKIGYNANSSVFYNGGTQQFKPYLYKYVPPKDNTDTTAFPPQLRIRLRNDLGEILFNKNNLSNLAAFQKAFKGLFITTKHSILPQPTYGSIFYVDMNATAILLYYHNTGGAQLPLAISCGSNSNRFGYFQHDYGVGSSDLNNQLSHGYDTTYTNNHNVYVQGLAGVRTVLKFPQLLKWATDSNITINKAEIVLTPDLSNSQFSNPSLFALPGRLYLEGDTSDNVEGLIENLYTFGGYYDPTYNQYVFEIPHSAGQIITRRTLNTKFYVSVFNSSLFPQRVVLGGPANKSYPMKLRLWYTRLSIKK